MKAGPDGRLRSSDLGSLARPLRVLIYLLIVLAVVELYNLASDLVLRLTNVVLIFVFAAVVAVLLTPLVDRVQAIRPLRRRRGLAVLVLYATVVLVLALVIALLAPTVAVQATLLGAQIPSLLDQAQRILDTAQGSLRGLGLEVDYRIPRSGASIGGDLSAQSLTRIGGVVTPIVNVLLVVVVSVYLTIEGRNLIATARNLFPARERAFDFAVLAVGAAIAAYVRAQLLMSLQPDRARSRGLHPGPPDQRQGHPHPPPAAMGALLVGAELAGILGALMAIPTAVIGNIFFGALYASSQGRDGMVIADTPGPVGVADLPSLADEIAVGTPSAATAATPTRKPRRHSSN